MWIVVAVILALVLSRALNKASRVNDNDNGNENWRKEDDWAQLDADLEKGEERNPLTPLGGTSEG